MPKHRFSLKLQEYDTLLFSFFSQHLLPPSLAGSMRCLFELERMEIVSNVEIFFAER
jgi:hypothetical protein